MMIIIAGSLCLGLQCLEKAQPCTTALTFGRTTWIREAQQINQLGGGDPGLVCSGEESRVVETGDQVFLLLPCPWNFSERNTGKQQFSGQGPSIVISHREGSSCCPGQRH